MSAVANQEEVKQPAAQKTGPLRSENYVTPEVNIFETKDGYVLEAEVPGVSKEGVEIDLEGTTMTITGRRVATEVKAEAIYAESVQADYRRAFELDPAIDTARIEAKLNQGVLTVNLPKSEAVKPRKITVNE